MIERGVDERGLVRIFALFICLFPCSADRSIFLLFLQDLFLHAMHAARPVRVLRPALPHQTVFSRAAISFHPSSNKTKLGVQCKPVLQIDAYSLVNVNANRMGLLSQ